MDTKNKCGCRKSTEAKDPASTQYPGVAVDKADDDKVSQTLVDERTSMLNNNPRNNK